MAEKITAAPQVAQNFSETNHQTPATKRVQHKVNKETPFLERGSNVVKKYRRSVLQFKTGHYCW